MRSKIEAATTWMENLAADNSHGYSQANRWGPDYDCSSAVRDKSPGNQSDHAAMYIGGGAVVHARSSEGNSIPGDQSGNEIRVQKYFNSWDCVLRYPEVISYDDETGEADPEPTSGQLQADGICGPQTWETISDMIAEMPQLECVTDNRGKIIRMPSGWHVAMLQAFLNYCDPDADLDVDGDYGPLTAAAVKQFQRRH